MIGKTKEIICFSKFLRRMDDVLLKMALDVMMENCNLETINI